MFYGLWWGQVNYSNCVQFCTLFCFYIQLSYPTFRCLAIKGSSKGILVFVNKPEVQTCFCNSDMEVCSLFFFFIQWSNKCKILIASYLLNYKFLLAYAATQHCFDYADSVSGLGTPDVVRICFNCLSRSFPLLIIQTIACLYRIKYGASLINSHKKENCCSPVHIFTQIYDLFPTINNISNVLFISYKKKDRKWERKTEGKNPTKNLFGISCHQRRLLLGP